MLDEFFLSLRNIAMRNATRLDWLMVAAGLFFAIAVVIFLFRLTTL